jgi:hypothetical protein
MNKTTQKVKNGTFCEINIEGLGEFKFLFSKNPDVKPGTNKYYVESIWNPKNYGKIDFIVGYYVSDINEEIQSLMFDMSYFIDGAKIACEIHVEEDDDIDGVYTGILCSYFGVDMEDIEIEED